MSPTEPDGNRHALLQEGARSYLEALTAITIFRRDVRSVCQEVVESRSEAFLRALAVPINQAERMVPYETPEEKFNGSSAYVGVQQKISRRRNQGFIYISSCGLSWDLVGQQRWFGCWVGVWFNQRDMAERLYAGFQKKKPLPPGIELETEKNSVSLSRALKPEDMASLSDRLGEVMDAWIQLWEQVGGLDALTSKQA
jgi:hypothetical protein